MNLKKIGRMILLTSLTVAFLLNFVPVNFQVRLFIGSFGIGSGIVLMVIGSSNKYEL